MSLEMNKKSLSRIGVKEDTTQQQTMSVPSSNKLYCHDCCVMFSTISKLKYHRLKTHGKWSKKLWSCVECEKQGDVNTASRMFSTQSNLNRHLRNTHHTGPLLKHTQQIKDEASDLVETKLPVRMSIPKCPYCDHSTWDSYNLNVHIRKHTGN